VRTEKEATVLEGHSQAVVDLTNWLRQTVRAADPELGERVYVGWHGFGFHHPDAGYVCAVFPRAEDVLLAFEHGVDLPDPERRLQAGGKQVCHLVFTSRDAHPPRVIAVFVAAAVEEGVRRRQSGA
jgi:hypothetical protein